MGFNLQINGLKQMADRMRTAGRAAFKRELANLMMTIGADFLAIVQDVIISEQIVDTRLLLASFSQGGTGNIWQPSNGGLTIEVGSGVKYAAYVNDGHMQTHRWVPGRWEGGRFIYEPGAQTGMALRPRWIPGRHYWELALKRAQPLVEAEAAAAMDRWVAQMF